MEVNLSAFTLRAAPALFLVETIGFRIASLVTVRAFIHVVSTDCHFFAIFLPPPGCTILLEVGVGFLRKLLQWSSLQVFPRLLHFEITFKFRPIQFCKQSYPLCKETVPLPRSAVKFVVNRRWRVVDSSVFDS